MSHWNYRLVHWDDHGDDFLEIMEVYYDDAGKPNGYSRAYAPGGGNLDEINRIFADMKKALEHPVLDGPTLEKNKKDHERASKRFRL